MRGRSGDAILPCALLSALSLASRRAAGPRTARELNLWTLQTKGDQHVFELSVDPGEAIDDVFGQHHGRSWKRWQWITSSLCQHVMKLAQIVGRLRDDSQ